MGPDRWYSDDPTDQTQALAVCHDCPVRIDCLDAAVRRHEPCGIWGGVDLALPYRRLRRALATGNPIAYTAALIDTITRPPTPEGPCRRCGEPHPGGPWLPDENPPGATCARVATYNKGCRCTPCRAAKLVHDQASRTPTEPAGTWVQLALAV
jgi:hypothetical protein